MGSARQLRAGIYARVSTADQDCTGQLEALQRYAMARGWDVAEFVDHGVSGTKERRPALDALLAAARRRDVAIVLVTKLDRLARSLHQLGSFWVISEARSKAHTFGLDGNSRQCDELPREHWGSRG